MFEIKLCRGRSGTMPKTVIASALWIATLSTMGASAVYADQFTVGGGGPWEVVSTADHTSANVGKPYHPDIVSTTIKGSSTNVIKTGNLGVSIWGSPPTIHENLVFWIKQKNPLPMPQPSEYPFTIVPSGSSGFIEDGGSGWPEDAAFDAQFSLPTTSLNNLQPFPAGQTKFVVTHFGGKYTVIVNWHLPHENYVKDPNVIPKNPLFKWEYVEAEASPNTASLDGNISFTNWLCPEWIPESLKAFGSLVEIQQPGAELIEFELNPEYAALSEILGVGADVASEQLEANGKKVSSYGNLDKDFERGLNKHATGTVDGWPGGTVTVWKEYGETYDPVPTQYFTDGSGLHWLPYDTGQYLATNFELRRGVKKTYLVGDEYLPTGYSSECKAAPEQEVEHPHIVASFYVTGFSPVPLPPLE